MKHIIYLSIGSNLGDRQNNLMQALFLLGLKHIKVSSLYETEPVGKKGQGDFLNAVLGMSTELTPQELSRHTKKIEIQEGRTKNERWGPRELDIDILYYDALILNEPGLRIPHPEIDNRRFVLIPLAAFLTVGAAGPGSWVLGACARRSCRCPLFCDR